MMLNIKNKLVGLVSYQEKDSSILYGRDKEVENLLQIIQKNKLITLTGASGSGKSSLINAGLIPRLRKGFLGQAGKEWAICQFRPGVNPIENMVSALTNSGVLNKNMKANTEDFSNYKKIIEEDNILSLSKIYKDSEINKKKNLLIIVDQLEDLFVLNAVSNQNKGEDALLMDIISRTAKINEVSVYFLISLQADYISELSRYSKLQELFSKSHYSIQSIGNEGLKSLLKNNFIANGIAIDPEAYSMLLSAVSNDLSLLPNIQYLLYVLLNETDEGENKITVEKIENLGGIKGVIAKKIDASFKALSDSDQINFAKIVKATMSFENSENPFFANTITRILKITQLEKKEAIRLINWFKKDFGDSIEIFENKISGIVNQNKKTYALGDVLQFKYNKNKNWALENTWIEDEKQAYKNYKEYASLADKNHLDEISLMVSPELEMAINWKDSETINENWAKKYALNFQKTIDYINSSEKSFNQLKSNEERRIKRKKLITKRVISAISVLTIVATIMAIGAFINKAAAEKNFIEANKAKELALEKSNEADIARKIAQQKEQMALKEKQLADSAKIEAQKYLRIARKERREAVKSALEAEQQRELAKVSEKIAMEKQNEALVQKDNATKATAQAEKLKQIALLETEFYPVMLRLERLIDESSDADSNPIVIATIKEALLKYYQYKVLIEQTNSGKITTEGLFVLLQTGLKALENKNTYRETSMLIKKIKQNSSIRSISVYNDNIIALGGDDQYLYVLNGASKNEIPPIKINERIRKIVIANAQEIYVGTFKGNVYRINLKENNSSKRKVLVHSESSNIKELYYEKELNQLVIISSQGVSKVDNFKTTSFLKGKDIFSSYYTPENRSLLISTSEGLFSLENEVLSPININGLDLKNQKITAISTANYRLFLGTNLGRLYVYEILNNSANTISLKFDDKIVLHLSEITKLFFDKNNDNLYSASFDNQVLKYDTSLKNVPSITNSAISLNGHEKWVWDINMIKDQNGNDLLITADENGNLISWFDNIDELVEKVESLIK